MEGTNSKIERFTLQGGVNELRDKVIQLSEIRANTLKISNFLASPEPRDKPDDEKRQEPDTPLKSLATSLSDLDDVIRGMSQDLAGISNNLGVE